MYYSIWKCRRFEKKSIPRIVEFCLYEFVEGAKIAYTIGIYFVSPASMIFPSYNTTSRLVSRNRSLFNQTGTKISFQQMEFYYTVMQHCLNKSEDKIVGITE